MKTKRIIGYLLILLPFAAIICGAILSIGIIETAVTLGTAAAIVLMIFAGVELVSK